MKKHTTAIINNSSSRDTVSFLPSSDFPYDKYPIRMNLCIWRIFPIIPISPSVYSRIYSCIFIVICLRISRDKTRQLFGIPFRHLSLQCRTWFLLLFYRMLSSTSWLLKVDRLERFHYLVRKLAERKLEIDFWWQFDIVFIFLGKNQLTNNFMEASELVFG